MEDVTTADLVQIRMRIWHVLRRIAFLMQLQFYMERDTQALVFPSGLPGVKGEPAQCQEPKFLAKAGWMKKASGKLLGGYKDRYIHLEKHEIVVYEDENLQTCLERIDLENYDSCVELRSAFKKKNRLILIRAAKPANKVHDVKFQLQTPEEKDAWIKALSDGINRAKNKVFDEVKVDESSNLDHVTRSRPKGTNNRRPPTRIHMKEVATASSDGMLRLDLDLADATMPNGAHYTNVDVREDYNKTIIEVPIPSSSGSQAEQEQPEEEAQTETGVSLQKKVIKPPMPPSKEAKSMSAPQDQPDKNDVPEKKVLKPPMPPSKEAKPCTWVVEEGTEEPKREVLSEQSPDIKKKAGSPPVLPNKPISGSMNNLIESSNPVSQPPTPPSKDKKPLHPSAEPNQEIQSCKLDSTINQNENENEDTKIKDVEQSHLISKEAPLQVRDDCMITECTSAEGHSEDSKEESKRVLSSGSNKSSENELQLPVPLTTVIPDAHKKSPSPLLSPKKKPVKPVHAKVVPPSGLSQPHTQPVEQNTDVLTQPDDGELSGTSVSCPQVEMAIQVSSEIESEVPAVVVSLSEPVAHSLSPLMCHLHGVKKKKEEEKSVDSGQHSDDDSEGSESEDNLAASTAALRGSNAGLDVLDNSEDDIHMSDSPRLNQAMTDAQVRAMQRPCHDSRFTTSSKPTKSPRSASIGDLLAASSGGIQVRQHSRAVDKNVRATASSDNVTNLETEVALEMKKTSELLNSLLQCHDGGDTGDSPETLLAKAMEKLKKADHFLREIKKLKDSNLIQNENKRNSW